MNKEEKVLTYKLVKKLGLDKLEVITSDMIEGYTSIGGAAFRFCSSITSIILPNSITSIGKGAFSECSALTSITIPNSVTSIGYCAFYKCSSITSITLPNSITSIGEYAFEDCSSITSITLPNSITSIGDDAFCACNKLKKVIIVDKPYETQEVVNGKCKAYKAFNANLTCREFQYEEGKTYEIEGKPELFKHGFHACLNLKDVFSYYYGELGKDVVVHEVELEGVTDEINVEDSKVVAKKITIGKRIL